MILIASWLHRKVPVRFVETTSCHFSKGNSSNSKDFKVIFESLKKFENKIDF